MANKPISEAVYENALANAQMAAKPTYAGSYEGQLSDIFDQIQNRPKFSYDVNADPLYQQYKDSYIQQGKLAMKDTMGQAAALTGGYGSTYGQQVGQQAYDAYLQNLSAQIPELYGMALDQYNAEGDRLKDLYGMVGERRDTEYGQYRDTLGDWERQMQQALENERFEREWDRTEDQIAYGREQDAKTWQQQYYQNLFKAIQASGQMPSEQELMDAGMTREQAQALRDEYLRQVAMDEAAQQLARDQLNAQIDYQNRQIDLGYAQLASRGSSGGGGGGGGSTRYYYTQPDGMTVQDLYNLTAADTATAATEAAMNGIIDLMIGAIGNTIR